jgi:hypothetical protein
MSDLENSGQIEPQKRLIVLSVKGEVELLSKQYIRIGTDGKPLDRRLAFSLSLRLPIEPISLSRSKLRCYNRPKSYATVGLIQGLGKDSDGTETVALDRDYA